MVLEKPIYRGITKKGELGQFVDLRGGGGWQERGGWCFWGGVDTLMPTMLGLIKHDMINLFYYEDWTDKWKYIPYISVTHKVLRSKTATLAHVCDVHGASLL